MAVNPTMNDGHVYPVNNIYPTIQGEGVHAGKPATFVRLQGCDVGCPWCDTKETWEVSREGHRNWRDALGQNANWGWAPPEELAEFVNAMDPRWIVITGGEPSLYLLGPLVRSLHRRNLKVAIETSGTETLFVGAGFDWVTVSPKIGMPGGKSIKPEAISAADEIKHVVGRNEDVDNLLALIEGNRLKRQCQIVVQPVSQSKKATDLCIAACMAFGWRLSIQVHKYINLP